MTAENILRVVRLTFLGFVVLGLSEVVRAQGHNVEFIGRIGGACRTVYVEGNRAYVSEGPNLSILDTTTSPSPILLGRVVLPAGVRGVFVVADVAYVADDVSGLQIVDVSDPSSPVLVGSRDTPGCAESVVVSGGVAYVAQGHSGVQIIDVGDPSAPTLLGSRDTSGYARDVSTSGSMAYVAQGHSGLQIIDVSDPSQPELEGSCDTPGYARGVYCEGGFVYIADDGSGLQVIDVSAPSSPTLLGSFETSGSAEDVFTSGSIAYIADNDSGLQIVDVSAPTTPALVGSCDTPGHAKGLSVAGGVAYVADWNGGLQIVDVGNSSSPTLQSSYDIPIQGGPYEVVHTTGSLAYAVDRYSGALDIIDVSSPPSPTLLGSCNIPGGLHGAVHVTGNFAYVVGYGTLQIIDVSNSSSPTISGSYDTAGSAHGIHVVGDLAYVADGYSGLQIVDVSDPSSPTLGGSWDTPGYALDAYVSGTVAYIADYGSGLQILDVSNPSSPTLHGACDTPGHAWDVFVSGNMAYVSDEESFQIIDVSDPSSPTVSGSYSTPGRVRKGGVFVANGLAYVAEGYSGIQVIDVSSASSPVPHGSYDTPGWAGSVIVAGGLAYVADHEGGLLILRYSVEDIACLPTWISVAGEENSGISSETLLVWNGASSGTLTYGISTTPSWLSCLPTTGRSTSDVTTHTVTIDPTGLGVGSHGGTITITAAGASNSPVSIPVSFVVESLSLLSTVDAHSAPQADLDLLDWNDTEPEKMSVLKFRITDPGGDSLPTRVDRLTIDVGGTAGQAGNDVAWAELHDGASRVAPASSITDLQIVFGSTPNSDGAAQLDTVGDGGYVEYTVFIYLHTSLLGVHDQTYVFDIDETNVGVDGGTSSRMDSDTAGVTPVVGTLFVTQLGITVSPNIWAIGPQALGAIVESLAFSVTNTGNVAEDFTIRGADGAGGWNLEAAAGLNAFRVDIDQNDDGTYELVLGTSEQTFAANVAAGGAFRTIGLRYNAPTSDTLGGAVPQGFPITVKAIIHVP